MTLVTGLRGSPLGDVPVLLRSARLTLKQHRIEVGAAVAAALVVGFSAFVVAWRLNSVAMPAGCFDAWLAAPGAARAPDCDRAINLWTSIRDDEAAWAHRALAFLPLVGLTAGIPLIGREIEGRTDQTAWSLAGSRGRWLVRQVVPVLLVVAGSASFAALGADTLQATQRNTEVQGLWFHGPILVARVVAAFSVGVLAGAIIGRSLPAFIVGLVVCFWLASAAEPARITWLAERKTIVGDVVAYRYSFGVLLRAPDGTLYPLDNDVEAALAPSGEPEPETWLYDHGYTLVQLAVTDEAARGWIPYETAAWTAMGVAALAASALVIDRRRPA